MFRQTDKAILANAQGMYDAFSSVGYLCSNPDRFKKGN